MDTKSILASKTFWLNVVGLLGELTGILPPLYAAPILAVLNIALRFLTDKPVTLTLPGR